MSLKIYRCNFCNGCCSAAPVLQQKLQQFLPAAAKSLCITPPSLGCNCNHFLTTPSLRHCNIGMGWSGKRFGGCYGMGGGGIFGKKWASG